MRELLQSVQVEDMDAVIDLAERSYPEKVRVGVVASLIFQKQLMEAGITDGTQQFKACENEKIVGVCGLYKHGNDNPDDVIWGDWFFVDPLKRNSTLAYRMGVKLLLRAKQSGHRLFCVDTTDDNKNYFNIGPYLRRFGFREAARIHNFYEGSVDKVYFTLDLPAWQPHHLLK